MQHISNIVAGFSLLREEGDPPFTSQKCIRSWTRKKPPTTKKTIILAVTIAPVPFITEYSLYTQFMIILILITVNIYRMLYLSLKIIPMVKITPRKISTTRYSPTGGDFPLSLNAICITLGSSFQRQKLWQNFVCHIYYNSTFISSRVIFLFLQIQIESLKVSKKP